jgi:tRNA(Arg) A34 adenosine deaminase TadA
MNHERIVLLETIKDLRGNHLPREFEGMLQFEQDLTLLRGATQLALYSALAHGVDMPIGAMVGCGNRLFGGHFANDVRFEQEHMHAEVLAVEEALRNGALPASLTVATTVEPCVPCQDFLAEAGVTRVVFAITRRELEEMGMVHKRESFLERDARLHFPYEIVHIEDPEVGGMNRFILGYTQREADSGIVIVDQEGIRIGLDSIIGTSSRL